MNHQQQQYNEETTATKDFFVTSSTGSKDIVNPEKAPYQDSTTAAASTASPCMERHDKTDSDFPATVVASSTARSMAPVLLRLARELNWTELLRRVQLDPGVALLTLSMDNSVSTTLLHLVIAQRPPKTETRHAKKRRMTIPKQSPEQLQIRLDLIETILRQTPQAARMVNGENSLPLHVCAQRNAPLKSHGKERVMRQLIELYPPACTQRGGPSDRTPVHIAFTDYLSPSLTQLLLQHGGTRACAMPDQNGYLPAHIAAWRYTAPSKLSWLLDLYPPALYQTTHQGETLLSLARKKATAAHPNQKLIAMIEERIKLEHCGGGGDTYTEVEDDDTPRLMEESSILMQQDILEWQDDDDEEDEQPYDNDEAEAATRRSQEGSRKRHRSDAGADLLLHFSHKLASITMTKEPHEDEDPMSAVVYMEAV